MASGRLEGLPAHPLPGGLRVIEASTITARLLGLALLDALPQDKALLLPGCHSVHTFGMRFPIDVVFLDRHGRADWIEPALPPRKVAGIRAACSVLETRAGHAERFVAAGAGELAARLSRPRRPAVAAGS